jgi:hypothetical protein
MTSFMMSRPQTELSQDFHQATFRSLSPAAPLQTSGATPQTGLGILMNNKQQDQFANHSSLSYSMANMTPEQQKVVRDDLADRERQASALAAAGMVAESVSRTQNGAIAGEAFPAQGLHAPPMLGSAVPPPSADPGAGIDSINWNLMDLGPALDDMEMDFAKLFDPAHEEANMQTEGSGWPTVGDAEFPDQHSATSSGDAPPGDVANV